MKAQDIPKRTILPIELVIADWLSLVKQIKIVRLPNHHHGLLIEGRGFRRMLDAEYMYAASVLCPTPPSISRPRVFFSRLHASSFAESLGLGRLLS